MNLKKGTILEWTITRELYSAKKGVQAILINDYNNNTDNYVHIHWIDDKANGQQNGDYEINSFIVVKKIKTETDPIKVLMQKIGYNEGEIDYA